MTAMIASAPTTGRADTLSIRDPLSIHVDSLTVTRGGRSLFEPLRLTIEAGRWTCLLGASGCGKTTLLRLLAGLDALEPPTRITIDDNKGGDDDGRSGKISGKGGKSGNRVSPLAGRVAYMAQEDLLLPWLSVHDNVLLGPRLRSRRPSKSDRARADALLARVGLLQQAKQRPDTLSGGMRQRVALARTLMEDQPVVLMDEPFSAVDAITRRLLQDLAAELLAGRTVVLVTHDPLEALRLGHDVFVLGGQPARITGHLTPPGSPPRRPGDTGLVALQAELLDRLAA